MRLGVALVLLLGCLVAHPVAGQIRRADFVILAGDTDDAIRFAKTIKDIFASDPAARRAVSQAREVLIQSWVEERSPLQLTEQERAAIQNPDRYDAPVVHDLTVTLNGSPPSILIGVDIPPRLWPRFGGTMGQVANGVARDGALFARKAVRVSMMLQGAETYRVNADADGNITVVFVYE